MDDGVAAFGSGHDLRGIGNVAHAPVETVDKITDESGRVLPVVTRIEDADIGSGSQKPPDDPSAEKATASR
ncbi:hypothetical protein MAE02_52070 [Microvirga aerophila]|uniref:Uncharacterized protein n=1 Tax=Microvirga aerophila TaxID=670291 RepID=A0A512BZX3_9HYPH|nr:hypothetical protein MAE02_52070 [Microvirga aerophila]